jgi:hypothetical protein
MLNRSSEGCWTGLPKNIHFDGDETDDFGVGCGAFKWCGVDRHACMPALLAQAAIEREAREMLEEEEREHQKQARRI